MKLTKKNIPVFASIILLLLTAFFLKEYFRKPADVMGMQPSIKTTVADIVDLYENDEAKANKLFLDKTIQINGAITEIVNQQDTLINVFVGDTNSLHKVSCLLDKRHFNSIKKYTAGQQITLKGICTGFLMDVELNRCVIVDDNEQ